jgi:hypothetical protein
MIEPARIDHSSVSSKGFFWRARALISSASDLLGYSQRE